MVVFVAYPNGVWYFNCLPVPSRNLIFNVLEISVCYDASGGGRDRNTQRCDWVLRPSGYSPYQPAMSRAISGLSFILVFRSA